MKHGHLYHQYLRAVHAERSTGEKALIQIMAMITSLEEEILKMQMQYQE